MRVSLIGKEQQKTSEWSGGTTTQIYIYPENADYKKRDFLFRISSAVCSDEKSVFTKLTGISRKLMVIDGRIELRHEGHHSRILGKYEQDSFEGDWNTLSEGCCRDFNLMTVPPCSGELEHIFVQSQLQQKITVSSEMTLLYVISGSGKFCINKEAHNLKPACALIIENSILEKCEGVLLSDEDLSIIKTDIYFE